MARAARSFRRQGPVRTARDYVLIVCEGAETEPRYFQGLVRALGFTSADIHICGRECGSDPVSVVKYACDLQKKTKPGFDYVFCVIDADSHTLLNSAKQMIRDRDLRGVKEFGLILSVPCFEYWLLLHHTYSSRPYVRAGKRSCGDMCREHLETYVIDYSKSGPAIFDMHEPHTDKAIVHARRRAEECARDGGDNPSTEAYRLVELLRHIAAEAGPA